MSFIKSKWAGSKFQEKLKEEKTERKLEPGIALSGLSVKVVEIGSWDMNATDFVSIKHGLTTSSIRMVQAIVKHDVSNLYYPIELWDTIAGVAGGSWSISALNIVVARTAASFFDSADFDDTTINRGYITIWYEP